MATTSKTRQAMSDEDLATLMGLIRDADSVELKLTVPDGDHRSTAVALGADALDSQVRQVIFFDTPDLTLQQHGLVVRARRIQRKGDDSVDQAPAGRPEGAAARGSDVGQLRRRGRRASGGLRLLRLDEGRSRDGLRSRHDGR